MTTSLASELFPAPDPRYFPTLTGRQEPHRLSVFDGDDTHGFKAITFADRITDRSMPWQCGHLRAILRKDYEGRWTHSDGVVIVPRQNGKSEIMLRRVLYGLFVLAETILYTVQRWDTGKALHRRLVAIITSRPSLRRRLAATPTLSQGRGGIILDNGAEVVTQTRSADVGRGLTKIDLLIYDEAYNLDEAASSAVDWAQMAAEDPQTIYTSTPVNAEQHPKGHVLAGMRRNGLAGKPGVYFAEHMAPEEMPHDEVATWQYGNPAYGVIQTAAKVQKMLRKAVTASGRRAFGVEALGRGIWPVDEEDVPELFPSWSDLKARSELLGPIALSLDMSPDRKLLVIAASQWTTDGRKHVEIGYRAVPSPNAVPYVAALIARWDPCVLVIDKASPAASMAPDLLNVDIEATLTNLGEMAQACGGFHDDAVAATPMLAHTGDPVIADAVGDATKKDLPGGGFVWKLGSTDLRAITLARWGLVSYGTRIAPKQEIVHGHTAPSTPQQEQQYRGETSNLATVGF